MLSSCMSCYAEDKAGDKNIPFKQKVGKRDINEDNVNGELQSGNLFVSFQEAEGTANITMKEMGTGATCTFSTSTLAPIILPGVDSEFPVQITIRTSDNNEYEGWLLP